MARSACGATRINSSLLDCEMDHVLLTSDSAYRDGIGVRPLCFSVDLDFSRARRALVFFRASFTQFRTWRMGTGSDHISGVSFDISLHPAELRCPEIQSVARTD